MNLSSCKHLITLSLVFLSPFAAPFASGDGASADPQHSEREPVLASSHTAVLPDENCAAFETATDFVEFDLFVKLQGRTVPFRFPSRYVDNPREYRNGAVRTTSFIRVDIDTFEPISRAEDGRRFKAGIFDKMGILFSDRVSLEKHAVIDANLATHLRWKLSDYAEEASAHGLLRLVYEAPGDETLIARNEDNEITDVFWCVREGSVPFPTCSHIFKFNGINVKSSYRRVFITGWREIRSRIEGFLACATRQQNKG